VKVRLEKVYSVEEMKVDELNAQPQRVDTHRHRERERERERLR